MTHQGWGMELDLLAEPCPSLLLTPNQNCVTAWASTHSSKFAASLLLFMLKSVSRKVSGLFRHPSAGKYLPSRGTRNTDVAFVNSALKKQQQQQLLQLSAALFLLSWFPVCCCSPFLYGSHPAAWQLQSFPHITHTVILPQRCRPVPIQRALAFFAASHPCLFICSSKATGIGYLNYFWLNPFQSYWNVWDISTLNAHLSEKTSMHTHINTNISKPDSHFSPKQNSQISYWYSAPSA